MDHYKSWSSLKKWLEENLCKELNGKVKFFLTRYHKVHDCYGRASIEVDGKELVNFSWIEMQIQDALNSDDFIIKILAIMDKRVGKRTLKRIEDSKEYLNYPDWVKQFYLLRLACQNELM